MATKQANTKAKKTNRDSYAGIPRSARAEVKKDLRSFRTMVSPQTVYEVMQETAKIAKRKDEEEKSQALKKRAAEERIKLSQEGRAEIRMALARVHKRMTDISLQIGLLKAGAEGVLPTEYVDEQDIQEICARSAYAAINTMFSDVSALERLLEPDGDPLGDEIRRLEEMEAANA